MRNYLEFEKEFKSLEDNLESSKNPFDKDGISEVDTEKIGKIQEEINEKLDGIYSNLNSWEKTLVARHEDRPRANFYINNIIIIVFTYYKCNITLYCRIQFEFDFQYMHL